MIKGPQSCAQARLLFLVSPLSSCMHHMSQSSRAPIWWANASFFTLSHVGALYGVYLRPPTAVPRITLVMTFIIWQLGELGFVSTYYTTAFGFIVKNLSA